ncbi:hypothetical protein V8C26DRAFT_86292 [Trichoderma gracile]
MDPLSVPVPPPSDAPAMLESESFTIPELNDSEYCTEVLRLPPGKSEAEADQELVARANAAGIAATLPSVAGRRHPASSCSVLSFGTQQDRSFSDASNVSASTALTPHSSVFGPPSSLVDTGSGTRGVSASSLTFSHYERLIASVDPASSQPPFPRPPPTPTANDSSAQSVVSVASKKSHRANLRDRLRWRKKTVAPVEVKIHCMSCQKSFGAESGALHKLSCGHMHCTDCVRDMVDQAVQHEARMPPRCCSQPLAAPLVRAVLTQDAQVAFLLAVLKLNTPAQERVFCPDPACGHFIPSRDAPDANHPFDLTCFKCNGRVCAICRGAAHVVGENCPQDWELAVLKKKQQQQPDGACWQRCYDCRALVEMAVEAPYMTCQCKARFCSVCAAIWDPTTGCPNLCSFEEELRRRQQILDAVSCEAELQIRANSSIQQLGQQQEEELRRFLEYKSQSKDALQTRHLIQEAAVEEKYDCQEEKLRERHERAWSQQEDRHVAAEMGLLESLQQYELNIHLRLKHMEAYCNGVGQHPSTKAPVRVVTERDLRELGQQYYLRDGMDRTRESKINLMRERQAVKMEELRVKQAEEHAQLTDARQEALDRLETQFVQEESQFNAVFASRQSQLQSRWVLAIEVLCKELEEQNPGQIYRRIGTPRWPDEGQL